jgi:hypothetical protein
VRELIYNPGRVEIGGVVVDPALSTADWHGPLGISVVILYRSSKGRYYEITIPRTWGDPSGRWLDRVEAAVWLALNGHKLPDDLKEFEEGLIE